MHTRSLMFQGKPVFDAEPMTKRHAGEFEEEVDIKVFDDLQKKFVGVLPTNCLDRILRQPMKHFEIQGLTDDVVETVAMELHRKLSVLFTEHRRVKGQPEGTPEALPWVERMGR